MHCPRTNLPRGFALPLIPAVLIAFAAECVHSTAARAQPPQMAQSSATRPAEGERARPRARPDYQRFTEKQAVKFNKVAKRRGIVYRRLAEYLVKRFALTARPGIGIDIGGGPGDLVFELATRSEHFYWVNTDINTWYTGFFAEEAVKRSVAHQTAFVFADACALPFEDAYADLVVSRGSYQFWSDLDIGLREVHRVLKRGGEAFIGRGFPPTMPEDEVRDLVKKRLVGGPKYDPAKDAERFRVIMGNLGVTAFDVIRHRPEDSSLRYGVWLYFRK